MATRVITFVMLFAALAGWGGAGWLVYSVPPSKPLAAAVFYLFTFTALSTSAALVAWAILKPRAEVGRLRSPAGYLGHSMLFSLLALFALWLQSLRILSPLIAFLLASLYAALELALLFGTRGAVDVEIPTRTYRTTET